MMMKLIIKYQVTRNFVNLFYLAIGFIKSFFKKIYYETNKIILNLYINGCTGKKFNIINLLKKWK